MSQADYNSPEDGVAHYTKQFPIFTVFLNGDTERSETASRKFLGLGAVGSLYLRREFPELQNTVTEMLCQAKVKRLEQGEDRRVRSTLATCVLLAVFLAMKFTVSDFGRYTELGVTNTKASIRFDVGSNGRNS